MEIEEKTVAPRVPYHPWIALAGGRRFLTAWGIFLVTVLMRSFHAIAEVLLLAIHGYSSPTPDIPILLGENTFAALTFGIIGVYVVGTNWMKYQMAKKLGIKSPDASQQFDLIESSETSQYDTRDHQ